MLRWKVVNRPSKGENRIIRYGWAGSVLSMPRECDWVRHSIIQSRFEYLSEQEEVNIIYKQYIKKKEGEAAPLSIRSLEPIVAIDQLLRHILPPYFQKSRYYGLHASATLKKYKDRIDQKLLQNRDYISQLSAVLKTLMKAEPYVCEKCQSTNFQISEIKKNTVWIFYFIILPKLRGPPKASSYPKKASAWEKQKFLQNRYAIMDRLWRYFMKRSNEFYCSKHHFTYY